jgi:hypothetical protein
MEYLHTSAIPARLQSGVVAIYGATTTNGFQFDAKRFAFGKVAQLPSQLPSFSYNGQSVFFKLDDAARVTYGSTEYFLLEESKIIFIEITPP